MHRVRWHFCLLVSQTFPPYSCDWGRYVPQQRNFSLSVTLQQKCSFLKLQWHPLRLILIAFITGNSSLEPLIEGLCAQIHVNLRWRVFGRNRTGGLIPIVIQRDQPTATHLLPNTDLRMDWQKCALVAHNVDSTVNPINTLNESTEIHLILPSVSFLDISYGMAVQCPAHNNYVVYLRKGKCQIAQIQIKNILGITQQEETGRTENRTCPFGERASCHQPHVIDMCKFDTKYSDRRPLRAVLARDTGAKRGVTSIST